MRAAATRTPFDPLPHVPAEAPVAVAVVLGGAALLAATFGGGARTPLVLAAALGCAVPIAACAALAVRRETAPALVALAVGTGTLAAWIGVETRDVLVAMGCAIPIAVLLLLALAPLVLVARAAAPEPDALEHHALTAAVWLVWATFVLPRPEARGIALLAAALAGWTAVRDAWRAGWLVRARAGAVGGVRLSVPWPGASPRVELVTSEGAGPFRHAERVERSEIVRVAWLRLAGALGTLGLVAAVLRG